MKNNEFNISLLKQLYDNPNITQREMAANLRCSLGKLNYNIKFLLKKNYLRNRISNNSKREKKYFITEKAINQYDLSTTNENFNVDLFNRKKTFLIAEAGINHNGSISDAKKLISLAKKHNFDAVKFQKRDLDICIPEHQKYIKRETPWGNINYLDYKKKIELNISQYAELKKFADKIGITLFVSCWDTNSLKLTKKLNFTYNKVPSAMITNLKFLTEVAKEKKKTFISTGMCLMKDIEKAVSIFKKFKCQFVLMHCVSVYPCDENKLNLNMIVTLKKKFKCDVGYSGHESSVSPSITAFFLGADYIERHITLDRAKWGTDQSASLEEVGMERLTTLIRKIPRTLGDGRKNFLDEEKKVSKKMRYWEYYN